ncbi:Acyl-CoA reductase (LuxC) [Rhodonellum ikkaensis]|nr:Acyl-CoA reductase (LuxC) [Rhodonellum ikkaensis]
MPYKPIKMTLGERIAAFHLLGKKIQKLTEDELNALAWKVENNNNWFTPEQTKGALQGLMAFLDQDKIEKWLSPYEFPETPNPKSVGILMAGNIPGVGFHDMLAVLLTGHRACVKLSSSDQVLIPWLVQELIEIEHEFKDLVLFEEMLKAKDAYIATGSDNSARYFDYYFGKYPSLIRKNRTSIGVLDGSETKEDFLELAKDIFQYFGLGCRNVSKIFVKDQGDLIKFLDAINELKSVANHHKYNNNYDYNKSIYLVNGVVHLDNGFLLLRESKELVSPISVIYYETYEDQGSLDERLSEISEKTQCVVTRNGWLNGSLVFGQSQCPTLEDYADGVNTVEFLSKL